MTDLPSTEPKLPAVHYAFVAIAALAAHGTMLFRGLVWDDRISREQMALQGHWLLFQADPFGFVRPGKAFIFSALDSIFGGWTPGWEAFALFTAVLASLAVLRFARELLPPAAALLAALVYAVHPLHVEATGWLSAVNGTWLTILAMAYYTVVLRGTAPIASTGLFIVALLLKEEAVVLPLTALLLLWYRRRQLAAWEQVPPWDRPQLAAFAIQYALAVPFILFTRYVSSQAGQELEPFPYADWIIALTAPRTIMSHIVYFFTPFRWAYWNYFNPEPAVYMSLLGFGWVAALALAVWLWLERYRPSAPLVFVLFAVIGLLPTSNLIPMGNNMFGPRYLAQAGVGLCLLAGWVYTVSLRGITHRFGRALVYTAAALWLVASGVSSAAFHLSWSNEEVLFTRMMKENRTWYFPLLLARVRMEQGKLEAAEDLVWEAIEIDPEQQDAYTTLGRILTMRGYPDEAFEAFQRAEEIAPIDVDLAANLGDYFDTLFTETNNPDDLAAAHRYYELARQGVTANAETAYVNDGLLWVMNGNPARGFTIWKEGQKKFPNSVELNRNLAIAAGQAN